MGVVLSSRSLGDGKRGQTYFSSTFCDRRSTSAAAAGPPPPRAPLALRPNMESRSAAKLCATVLVTRECLVAGGAEEEEVVVELEEGGGTYDSVGGAGAFPLTALLLVPEGWPLSMVVEWMDGRMGGEGGRSGGGIEQGIRCGWW